MDLEAGRNDGEENNQLSEEWLSRAPKHKIGAVITQCNRVLRERFPHAEKAKYGRLCRHLNDAQLKVFFDSIPPNYVRERFFFYTCFIFGLRIGEGLKIRMDDVDLNSGVLAVHSEKKTPGIKEFLPIPVAWVPDFEFISEKFEMFINQNNGYLFYSNRNDRLHWGAHYLRRIFRTVCEFPESRKVGLNKIYCQSKDGRPMYLYTPHSLRHSAGKRVCDLFGIRKAAEYLRQTDLKSTMIYTRSSVDELRDCANSLGSSMASTK